MSSADCHHLRAAQGWLELGNWREAKEELENIAAKNRAHPDVLDMRWQISAYARQWAECVDIGKALTKLAPDRAVAWIHYAYALHELKRTREAFEVLLPLAEKFPKEPGIAYNLACYCCQLDDMTGARDWLAMVFSRNDGQEWRLRAQNDSDLRPLWATEEEG